MPMDIHVLTIKKNKKKIWNGRRPVDAQGTAYEQFLKCRNLFQFEPVMLLNVCSMLPLPVHNVKYKRNKQNSTVAKTALFNAEHKTRTLISNFHRFLPYRIRSLSYGLCHSHNLSTYDVSQHFKRIRFNLSAVDVHSLPLFHCRWISITCTQHTIPESWYSVSQITNLITAEDWASAVLYLLIKVNSAIKNNCCYWPTLNIFVTNLTFKLSIFY